MMRCVASTLVSRILFVPPKMRLTDRRSNTTLWLPASGHIRLRPLSILLLPLALLMSGTAWSQSTVSMFSNVVPTTPTNKTTKATTLGVKFWSSQAGTISSILFYRAAKSPRGYVATLFSSNGSTVLGSVTMARRVGSRAGMATGCLRRPNIDQCEYDLRCGLLCAERPICRHSVRVDEHGDEWCAERTGGLNGRGKWRRLPGPMLSQQHWREHELFCRCRVYGECGVSQHRAEPD